jgi:hypothetical protein
MCKSLTVSRESEGWGSYSRFIRRRGRGLITRGLNRSSFFNNWLWSTVIYSQNFAALIELVARAWYLLFGLGRFSWLSGFSHGSRRLISNVLDRLGSVSSCRSLISFGSFSDLRGFSSLGHLGGVSSFGHLRSLSSFGRSSFFGLGRFCRLGSFWSISIIYSLSRGFRIFSPRFLFRTLFHQSSGFPTNIQLIQL